MTDFVRSNRRDFLLDTTRGLGGVALGAMLADDGITRAAPTTSVPDGLAHIAPQAKSVIWMFMVGGASHMETFDPKPALNKYAGISIDKTPFAERLKNPFVDENVRVVVPDDANGHVWPKVYPLQVGYRKRGESGIEVSDWWPHLGECIDDLAVVRCGQPTTTTGLNCSSTPDGIPSTGSSPLSVRGFTTASGHSMTTCLSSS